MDELLVKGVERRRRELELPNTAKALLIIDGCLAHDPKRLEALSKHHILFHFLVPHSSHLTQPLDCGVFSYFKQTYPNFKAPTIKNKMARQIVRGWDCLESHCTTVKIHHSFTRAGIILEFKEKVPTIRVDVNKWLTAQITPPLLLLRPKPSKRNKKRRGKQFGQ